MRENQPAGTPQNKKAGPFGPALMF